MRIVLDGRKLRDGGIGTYIQALIEGFCAFQRQLSLTGSSGSRYALTVIVNEKDLKYAEIFASDVDFVVDNNRPYSLGGSLIMPLRLRDLIAAADIFHAPHFNLPYFLTAPTVVTIHDTILLTHPRRKFHATLARRLIQSAMMRADRVITVSESSRDSLIEYFPWSEDKIHVVHNALPASFHETNGSNSTDGNGAPEKYFLFIGNERTHKGFANLIEGWRKLAGEFGDNTPKLVAVGGEFDNSRRSAQELGLTKWIEFKGEVREDQKEELIRNAEFLVMPSLEEGFGFPILEALSLGTPVIRSNIPVFNELFPQGTIAVKEISAGGFAAVVKSAINDPTKRQSLKKSAIQQAEAFTLTKNFFETLAIYEECIH